MIVPYNQMASFIVSGYRPLYTNFFIKDLTFTFENYVKSQLHLNVVTDLYGRDIFQYDKALKYLKGDDRFLLECSYVLRYFYVDMANILCNVIRCGIDSNINVSSKLGRPSNIPDKVINVNTVIKRLEESLSFKDTNKRDVGFKVEGIFARFNYDELDSLVADKNLALASIFSYYGDNNEELYILEVVEE